MSDVTKPDLMRAYQLIEDEELDEARDVLDSYLARDEDDADAWWLYAHAVTDPMEAQDALRNVLRIDPNYPGAKALLAESEAVLTPKTGTNLPKLTPRPVTVEDKERVPDFLDQLDTEDDDTFDTFDEDDDTFSEKVPQTASPAPQNRRLMFILLPILIAIVLLGGVVFLINNLGNRETPPPTQAAIVATDTSPVPTTAIGADSTAEITQDGFEAINAALSGYNVQSVAEEETSLGGTLIATICNDPAQGLVATTLGALDTFARQSAALIAEYLAVRVVDCDNNNAPLRTVALSITDAQEFAAGTIDQAEFRSRLQPIRE